MLNDYLLLNFQEVESVAIRRGSNFGRLIALRKHGLSIVEDNVGSGVSFIRSSPKKNLPLFLYRKFL